MKLPSSELNNYWIYHNTPQIEGKWMLFYPKDELDQNWIKTVKFLDDGTLPKIRIYNAKVSTMKNNPRASDNATGVIIMYTEGIKEQIMSTGESLKSLFDYKPSMYFKTESQTLAGTGATGCAKNYLFKIDGTSKSTVDVPTAIPFTAVGMQYRGNHVFTKDDEIRLEAEPNNKWDENAIKVLINVGHDEWKHVAYVSREDNKKLKKKTGFENCRVMFKERFPASVKLELIV